MREQTSRPQSDSWAWGRQSRGQAAGGGPWRGRAANPGQRQRQLPLCLGHGGSGRSLSKGGPQGPGIPERVKGRPASNFQVRTQKSSLVAPIILQQRETRKVPN